MGGETPSLIDAGNGSTTLAALTTATTTAQSISAVTLAGTDITGVDFGFNFDTIVNVANSGQGSLRQFITNANTLTNAGLAQVGQTAGRETTIFMISDGAAHAGLRAGIANQLTGGVAVINTTSTPPALTDSATTITGATQTANVGNTNAGTLGAGGSAGVDALALTTVNRPEVQIVDAGGLALGLDLQAANLTVRAIAIHGFGNVVNSAVNTNIRVGAFAGALIEQNVIGTTASSFTDPGAAARSGGDNVRLAGGTGGTIQNNLIGFSAGEGLTLGAGSTGWQILGNEIRGNGIGNPTLGGVNIAAASATAQGNLIAANQGAGLDMNGGTGSNTIVNNTVSQNGAGNSVTPGMRVFGSSSTIDRNILTANTGAGVMVTSAAASNVITRNSTFGNGPSTGQIGIDLLAAANNQSTGTAPFVTTNDSGDGDGGGNGLLNFPVITSAYISGGNLVLLASHGRARRSSASSPTTTRRTLAKVRRISPRSPKAPARTPTAAPAPTRIRSTVSIRAPTQRTASPSPSRRRAAYRTARGSPRRRHSVARHRSSAAWPRSLSRRRFPGTVYNDANRNSRIDSGRDGHWPHALRQADRSRRCRRRVPRSPSPRSRRRPAPTRSSAFRPDIYTLVLDDNATLTDTTPTLPVSWTAIEGSGGRGRTSRSQRFR